MPTQIQFIHANVSIDVEEEPSAVESAFAKAQGTPVLFTRMPVSLPVYVNPATIAYWGPSQERRKMPRGVVTAAE